MTTVYLLCGVPGSGKSWVCNQLRDKFSYVPNDSNHEDIVKALKSASKNKPLLTDCPFGESDLKDKLEKAHFTVKPYFIVEDPSTVADRYEKAKGRPIPGNHFQRAYSIEKRAKEWNAPYGTSDQMLKTLRAEAK